MQSNLNLDDYIRRARDRFSFLILYAPNFPPEDRTNPRAEFDKQRAYLQEILRRAKATDRRRWLEVVISELRESLSAYESGDTSSGLDILYSAEEHFKNAIQGKPFSATFITDAKGVTRAVVSKSVAPEEDAVEFADEAAREEEEHRPRQSNAESAALKQWFVRLFKGIKMV